MIHGCIQQFGKWISEKVNPENLLIQVILIQTIELAKLDGCNTKSG